ncbi:MAG: thermostable hemolysin [Gammaproteobacteria bacterium]
MPNTFQSSNTLESRSSRPISQNAFLRCTPSDKLLSIHAPHNISAIHRFIAVCFFQEHQAKIDHFLPELITLTSHNNTPYAALGYQSAAEHALFLEQYLDTPIDVAISTAHGAAVQRSTVFEVGNLAASHPGSTLRLILSLSTFFYEHGFRWLAVTMTQQVHHQFQRLGLESSLYRIAPATRSRLLNTSTDWGTYFNNKPYVYVASIEDALSLMRRSPLLAQLIDRGLTPQNDHAITLEA